MILTGDFIKLLSDDTSWTTGEDLGSNEDVLIRKNCARILHRYLQKVKNESDETANIPSPADIPDINDCRICAPHIAQVIAKGIMEPAGRGGLKLFEGDREVSAKEALSLIERTNGSELRLSRSKITA